MKDKNQNSRNGKQYWRSLDQLADTPEFREFLNREFPQGASEMNNDWSRRNFLTLMGASLAMAGLAGCRRPEQTIVPYVKPPEEIVPGVPQYYATTMPFGTSAYGLIVESHEGRPTKIEGNPKHPSTLGASNAWVQASILGLYDPDRSQRVVHDGQESSWDEFVTFWREHSAKYDGNGGEGLAVLSESFSSPTLVRLKKEFEKKYPRARWVTYDPISGENMISGVEIATGERHRPVYDLSGADVIVSLDCDLLHGESDSIANARGFTQARHLRSEHDSMNRLYALETGLSVTGASADHRLAVDFSQIGLFTVALARALGVKSALAPEVNTRVSLDFEVQRWVEPIAEDLMRAGDNGVVLAGYSQPPEVHALAFAINYARGCMGTCLSLHRSAPGIRSDANELKRLVREIEANGVTTLIMMGGNPVYTAPVDLSFAKALKKVEHKIHLSDYYNKTSRRVTWHIPQAHYLESWGDAYAGDGTRSVIQPLITPLFDSVPAVEFSSVISSGADKSGYEIVRETWDIVGGNGFEARWRKILHHGVYGGSSNKAKAVRVDDVSVSRSANILAAGHQSSENQGLDVAFRISPSVYDGRYANNGWLQELPHPITKLTWDNAAQISPRTAQEYDLKNEDIVKLSLRERELEIPVWIVPGMADNTVVLELGYGQENLGRVADGVGFNTYALRTSEGMYYDTGLTLTKTGKTYPLASTQDHGSMEERPLVREATLDEYRKHPNFAPEAVHHPPLVSMWEDHKYDKGYQWGMAIDLTACVGCNACTVACQSENNIPIVGKEQVRNGREMHWIRVDRYFTGDASNPAAVHQPVACQHCEMAPCEQVCPVAATMHDEEGLNTMVYNRCIGTRYCANNCPYKVRRFNFFNFTKNTPEVTKMVHNPDVTVRSRGVMEKCTYCVQRINRARIEAKKEDRQVKDGEVVAACQQACPTGAITFGDINDPESKVSKVKKRNRNYELLGELNVRPRTSYLAKIRNPNPKLFDKEQK